MSVFDTAMLDFEPADAEMIFSMEDDYETTMDDDEAYQDAPIHEVDMTSQEVEELEMADAIDENVSYEFDAGANDAVQLAQQVFDEPVEDVILDTSRASLRSPSPIPHTETDNLVHNLTEVNRPSASSPSPEATNSNPPRYIEDVSPKETTIPEVSHDADAPKQTVEESTVVPQVDQLGGENSPSHHPADSAGTSEHISASLLASDKLYYEDGYIDLTESQDAGQDQDAQPDVGSEESAVGDKENVQKPQPAEGFEQSGLDIVANSDALHDSREFVDEPPFIVATASFDNHWRRFTLFKSNTQERENKRRELNNEEEEAERQENEEGLEHVEESDIPALQAADHEEAASQSAIPPMSPLFHDRPGLFYEPLFQFMQELRVDSTFNHSGRLNNNMELILSIAELELSLPEDNIHAREVTLHDLQVLYDGCDLNGPMTLRFEIVTPRFGFRYSAIRDEIARVVAEQAQPESVNAADVEEVQDPDVAETVECSCDASNEAVSLETDNPTITDAEQQVSSDESNEHETLGLEGDLAEYAERASEDKEASDDTHNETLPEDEESHWSDSAAKPEDLDTHDRREDSVATLTPVPDNEEEEATVNDESYLSPTNNLDHSENADETEELTLEPEVDFGDTLYTEKSIEAPVSLDEGPINGSQNYLSASGQMEDRLSQHNSNKSSPNQSPAMISPTPPRASGANVAEPSQVLPLSIDGTVQHQDQTPNFIGEEDVKSLKKATAKRSRDDLDDEAEASDEILILPTDEFEAKRTKLQ